MQSYFFVCFIYFFFFLLDVCFEPSRKLDTVSEVRIRLTEKAL
jgi:hypothetical protein